MARTKDIGVGVVGLGMGSLMLGVNALPQSRLQVRGVCDLDERLVEKAGRTGGVSIATSDFRELLHREEIDVVGIYTPDDQHCEQILQALYAGKHVVVTKPMVNTVEEAERVVAAVRQTGKKLLVGQTMRFKDRYVAVKKLLDSGAIGRPVFVEASYVHDMRPVLRRSPWRRDPSRKIWLVGAACHPLDLVQWYAGDVAEVSASANDGGILEDRAGDNNFVLNLRFRSGAIGRVLALFGIVQPPGGMDELGLHCTRGSVLGMRYTLDAERGPAEHDLGELMRNGEDEGPLSHGGEVIRYMRHFEECLAGRCQPLVDAVQAAKTVALSHAALRSIEARSSEVPRVDF